MELNIAIRVWRDMGEIRYKVELEEDCRMVDTPDEAVAVAMALAAAPVVIDTDSRLVERRLDEAYKGGK